MQRYLFTARRFLWVLIAVVAILTLSGGFAAYGEYVGTFESAATIWVQRNSQDLLQSHVVQTDVPSVPDFLTPGGEYAEAFTQLVQTQAFLGSTIERTSLQPELKAARDPLAFLDDVRKRFKIQALGTNLVKVSYRADSATVAFEMVSAAIAIRDERAAAAQIAASSMTTTLYTRELDLAHQNSLRAQADLDTFNAGHKAPLDAQDAYRQQQLRTASDVAQARVDDLRAALDRQAIVSTLLQVGQSADVQMIDAPQLQLQPSGGLRQAILVFGVAMAGAITLAALLVVLGTLLTASIASEADLERLGTVNVVASIPELARGRRGRKNVDLGETLATLAFGATPTKPVLVAEKAGTAKEAIS